MYAEQSAPTQLRLLDQGGMRSGLGIGSSLKILSVKFDENQQRMDAGSVSRKMT